ncbi:unnamed protein product [Peronospora farinosa]|uniref:RING-type domain-containing protein n=1 Tax=Peronospora farinosa TaxID=134698 RepID=A0AAV0TVB2_9STRA|nr:unnamed protein product [Peronospora farinosa]CAI5726828.1 unnamed protein product [Peronospora farinosa]
MDGASNDHHSDLKHGRPAPSKKPQAVHSNEHVRRNRMNMEKMIMKNVAASRNSTKNRAQQIVEALKKKRQLEEETPDETDRQALKKNKTSPPPSDVTTRTAVVAGLLSPVRRAVIGAAPAFSSPTRRQKYPLNLKSPTSLHLSSPLRPPKNPVLASPARPKRTGTTASPLRRSEFLTSPLRHRASASPKRPLMFEDNAVVADVTASRKINGYPPLLSSALEQVEVAPAVTIMKVTKTAKSPFQSFQAKVKQSPARPTKKVCSPGRRTVSTRAESTVIVPGSGPAVLDLSQSGDDVPQHTTATITTSSSLIANALCTAVASSSADPTSSVPSSLDELPLNSPTQCLNPMRKLLSSSRPVVAQRSICFSMEGVATALDVTPDGETVVVGFMDGSVRLYEMDSSVPSDRYGYLLGHIDEQSSQGSHNVHLRVKIAPDGRYVFVGCRQGPRVVMSINLDNYRSEKNGDDDDFQQFQKHFHSNGKLRGFADVTTYVPPADMLPKEYQNSRRKRSAYYILTGLGVGNLNLWRFVEPERHQQEPIWNHLQNFFAGGNTAMTGSFLPSSISPGVLTIAAVCKDKNLRVWPLEFKKTCSSSIVKSNNDHVAEIDATSYLGGNHTVTTHFSIPNTSDIIAVHGQYAYGISLMGEAYRICFPDSPSFSTCKRLPRQEFELEKIGGGGGGTSRRSNIMLESLSASDDGKAIIAVSTEGIFYYSNKLPDVGSSEVAELRIIGKNASENTLFKTPMKVYTPLIMLNGKKTQSEAMMAVVTNPSNEDIEKNDGYINVDPTEIFAARWMVPSRGNNCWVCGVRNLSHWIGPPMSKTKEPNRVQLAADLKEKCKVQRRRERALKRAKDTSMQQKNCSNSDDQETQVSNRTKMTPLSSAKKAVTQKQTDAHNDASSGSGAARSQSGNSRQIGSVDDVGDGDEDYTGSDDNTQSVASLVSELEHLKKRNAEIKTEWQRRLQGERQLRRKWKQREDEFLDQLNDSLIKLDAAEVEVDRLRVLLCDAEKRFAFEKVRVEQDNSVKSRYEQLCEHMNDKMALVADQKRLLEQTTRSLLAEVDRNVHALKNAVILEKSECVVCKDQQAVTAVVPCGHMCFCEKDAETYRHNCTFEYPTCPICQQEIVSLLRVYT